MLRRVLVNFVGLESYRVLKALKELDLESVLAYDVEEEAPSCASQADYATTYRALEPQSLISAALDAGCDAIYHLGSTEIEAFATSSVCANLRLGYLNGPPDTLATLMNRVGIRWAASDLNMAVVTTSEKIESEEDGEYWLIRLGLPLVLRTLRAPSQKLFTEEEARIAIAESIRDGAVVLERLLPDVREVETVMFSNGKDLPVCLGEGECSLRIQGYRSLCEFHDPK